MKLAFRLLCLICGILLATISPTIISQVGGQFAELYIYGGGHRPYDSYKVLNGYYTVAGILLTMVGFVLIFASYYKHEET